MVFKQGSRSIGCTNYVLRVSNSQESKIIQLLESYGKEVTDFGGLEKGIAYDRSFIKRRPASQSLQNDANEYAIIYWQTYGQPEEVFKTFSDLYKELQQILDSPEDPKDREEVAALTKLFKKHSETIKDDGWRNKITFGKNNSMFKKVSQIPGFASISQYYVIYFVVGRLAAKNRAINNSPDLPQQQSYQNFDNFCARLDDYILDNSEK